MTNGATKIALDELTPNNLGQLKAIAKNITIDPLKAITRLAYLNDVCSGCIVAHSENSRIVLDCLAVLPAYQNCGLEHKLWDYLKTLNLNISGTAQLSQVAFFESVGCVFTGNDFEYTV
jgi:hypothetical protein